MLSVVKQGVGTKANFATAKANELRRQRQLESGLVSTVDESLSSSILFK